MGYSEESKSYQLFDPVKQKIIVMRNVIVYEKYLGLKMLKYSSSLLNNDPFDIVSKSRSTAPLLGVSTCSLTYLPK